MMWIPVLIVAVFIVVGVWIWALRGENPTPEERERGIAEHLRAIQTDPADFIRTYETDAHDFPSFGLTNVDNSVPTFKPERSPVERMIDLWNREGGWIPGAAYKQVAEALGVDPDRLTHYEQGTGQRVAPGTHRYYGDGDGKRCVIIVSGAVCGKPVAEHGA